MSWGDTHYLNYCIRLEGIIVKKKLRGKKLKDFLDKKWEYVSRHAGLALGKESFIEDIEEMIQIRKSFKKGLD